jgi:hypothetical protein
MSTLYRHSTLGALAKAIAEICGGPSQQMTEALKEAAGHDRSL